MIHIKFRIRTAILGLLFLSFNISAEELDMNLISKVETQTRDQCQKSIDDDTLEFKKCIQNLVNEFSKSKAVNIKSSQIGIYYYAWLASVVAAKNGISNAEETAEYFLPKFRVIQKDFQMSDKDLCNTISGDCLSRNARMNQMQLKLEKDKKLIKTKS